MGCWVQAVFAAPFKGAALPGLAQCFFPSFPGLRRVSCSDYSRALKGAQIVLKIVQREVRYFPFLRSYLGKTAVLSAGSVAAMRSGSASQRWAVLGHFCIFSHPLPQ